MKQFQAIAVMLAATALLTGCFGGSGTTTSTKAPHIQVDQL